MKNIIIIEYVIALGMMHSLCGSKTDYKKDYKAIFDYMTQEIKEGMDPSEFTKDLKTCSSWTDCLYKCKRLALNNSYYNSNKDYFEDCMTLFDRIRNHEDLLHDNTVSRAASTFNSFFKHKKQSFEKEERESQAYKDKQYFAAIRHRLLLRVGYNEDWNPYIGLVDECQESLKEVPDDHEKKHLRGCCNKFFDAIKRFEYYNNENSDRESDVHNAASELISRFWDFDGHYATENPREYWDKIIIKKFKEPQKVHHKRLKNSCVQLFFKDKEGVYHRSFSKNCMLFLEKIEDHCNKKQNKKLFKDVASRDNLWCIKMLQSIVRQKDRQALAEGVENFLHKKKK